MAKKNLTVKQKQKKYRALQYTTFGSEFVSIFTPFIVMGAINFDEWFTVESGWKVGLGGSMALALLGIATLLITKKKENNSITDGYITLIVGWFATAFIFGLLATIMDQIATIMMWGGVGLLGAFGLNQTSLNFKKKADTYKSVLGEVAKDDLKEQAKKELERERQAVE